jgi:arylsulfatase A-like enzyme
MARWSHGVTRWISASIAGIAASILLLGAVAVSPGSAQVESSVPDAAPRPDIVVIYVDDFPQQLTELWSDPTRTPALARFVDDGLWLEAASGSTPTCCPGRVNTLTGTWGHRSGVTENDMAAYDPADTIAVRLQEQGYRTYFGGKFLNRLPRYVRPPSSVERYAAGWDEFDVGLTNHGAYYDYPLWTRSDGRVRHGDAETDHSTYVVTNLMTEHIRATPPEEPIFAFLSLFDGHAPYEPMPRFVGDPACTDVAPWAGPAYDEADVSDKPAWVQALPRLAEPAYDLRTRCEEVLTIDWAVAEVTAALEEAGRLDDTLLVFTADNGYLIGDHRITDKLVPYATPVPLYVRWPARWGDEARTIDEPVSNVDLAPTFCALAGCDPGDVDGLDLTSLLDGEVTALGRRFIYEEYLHTKRDRPAWYGLRTTGGYAPDGRWAYTEYDTGEVELYDLVADPWQLENVAGAPEHAALRDDLAAMLHDEVIVPDGVTYLTSSAGVDEAG